MFSFNIEVTYQDANATSRVNLNARAQHKKEILNRTSVSKTEPIIMNITHSQNFVTQTNRGAQTPPRDNTLWITNGQIVEQRADGNGNTSSTTIESAIRPQGAGDQNLPARQPIAELVECVPFLPMHFLKA